MRRVMPSVLAVISVAIAALLSGEAADAGTAAKTLQTSAQIIPGNSVSVYLVHGEIVTITRDDSTANLNDGRAGILLTSVTFETKPAWRIVKHVTFDKSRHLLTVDF